MPSKSFGSKTVTSSAPCVTAQTVPGKMSPSPWATTSRGLEPKFEKIASFGTRRESPPGAGTSRQICSLKLAVSRFPAITPPKFVAVYSQIPFVEELNVVNAPSSVPGTR